MKSLMMLWQVAAIELAVRCGTSTSRDYETVVRRSEHEGESFLTISLPAFCKDFEKSLDEGRLALGSFVGWKTGKDEVIPLFLGGFMARVFDRRTGWLLDEPDVDAIFAIRQLTLMFSKILIPCSDARVKKAIDGYIECEKEVRRNDADMSELLLEEFEQASLVIFGDVLQQVDEDIYYRSIIPKHGPGATADRLKGNRKFDQAEWTERLERIFPFGDFLVPNPRYHLDTLSRVEFLEPGAERPVRVITVPKTLKTPRIIAIEPTCMQYVQQGIMARLVEYLESPLLVSRSGVRMYNRAHGLVGFTDQVPNQHLARDGSLSGELATLDLSEASDRVSNQLVRRLLERHPHLAEGVDACRSRKADVPGHGVIRLAKFASMGSALTFPVEAMVFATVAMMGIAAEHSQRVTPALLSKYRNVVRVYGDDIIVPVDSVHSVVRYLEAFGFRVNRGKSFWTGKFRESCGKEYYAGTDVSIARVRRHIPAQLDHVEEIVSAVSLRNQFYELGMWQTAKHLDNILDKVLQGNYPLVAPESPVLGRVSASFGYETQKMHATLHSPLVRGYVVQSRIPASPLSGVGALLKCLLKQGDEPFADSRHLQRGGRPDAVNIKLRWSQPF